MTGDILGTLRYMSPEQLQAKHGVLDHRTDVYSLGLTLYELITLQPAFPGEDRQNLIRQVMEDDPRPPRQLNKAIPTDLETIVLKATAKEPQSRYATAGQLADDLRRFLDEKPIEARQPTLVQKAAKWSRRHRRGVMTGLAVGFAVILLALGLVWHGAWREARQRERAEEQRERAEENLRLALEAMDQIYFQFAKDTALELPPQKDVSQEPIPAENEEFLKRALAFYERFAQANRDQPSVRHETAKAYNRVGNIRRILHMHKEAEAAYSQAIQIAGDLVADFPNMPDYRDTLARAYGYRAHGRVGAGNLNKAIEEYTKAIRADPRIADGYYCRGTCYLEKEEYDRAIADLNEAIRLNPEFVSAYLNRGNAFA